MDRASLEERTLTLQRLVDSLEDQLRTLNRQLAESRDEALAQQTSASQMKLVP